MTAVQTAERACIPSPNPIHEFTVPLDWSPVHECSPRRFEVAGCSMGRPDAPAVLVMGGLSADRRPDRWWSALVGPGRLLDPARVRIIAFDWLGGWGESTRSEGPDSAPVDTRDQAEAAIAVLDELGIDRLQAVIGASYGGLVAQQLASRHPGRIGRAVIIAAGHRPHPLATAWRSVQRWLLREGQRLGHLREATAVARGLAMVSYRSHQEFAQRFDARPRVADGLACFPVEDYLRHCGERFSREFGGWAFYRLSESIDLHQVSPEEIAVPVDLVGFDSDQLVPEADLREFRRRAGHRCRLWLLSSRYGHDGFLKDAPLLRPILSRALEVPSC